MTGQYSRLGTLLDPLVDRALVLSGVIVCWRFELLPRWALALLAVRELFVIALVRFGQRHGVELRVNWLGRAGVWPVMSALFFGWRASSGSPTHRFTRPGPGFRVRGAVRP